MRKINTGWYQNVKLYYIGKATSNPNLGRFSFVRTGQPDHCWTSLLRNSYNPVHWFKQVKRTVSFDLTARFNPIQQSTAMYNSHIFNGRNTTINDRLTPSRVYRGFFYYPCLRKYFYINHMYSKSSHCNISKLSDYYKNARSFTLFSLRKCMQLHHFIW